MAPPPKIRRDPFEFIKSRIFIRQKALHRIMKMVLPYKFTVLRANILLFLASTIGSFVFVAMVPFFNHLANELNSDTNQPNAGIDQAIVLEAESPQAPEQESEEKSKTRQRIEKFIDDHPSLRGILDGVKNKWASFQKLAQDDLKVYILCFTLFIITAMIVAGFLQFSGNIMLEKVGIKVTSDLLRKLYANVLDQDMDFFDRTTTGSLLNTCYRQIFMVRPMIKLLVSTRPLLPLKMLILFVAAMCISVQLSMLLLMLLPIVIVPTMILTSRLRKSMVLELAGEALPMDIMTETFHGIRAIKAFGAEDLEKDYMDPAIDQYVEMTRKRRTAEAIIGPVVDILNTMLILIVFAMAFVVFRERLDLSVGILMGFMAIVTRFYKPFRSLMTMNMQIQRTNAIAERVFQLMDHKPSIGKKADALDFPKDWDALLLRNIGFSYTLKRQGRKQTRKVLERVYVNIKRGEMVAIVGPNGTGKSTIVNLICRLYDPTEGRILFGGVRLDRIKISELRKKVCLITQKPILFNRSAAENIAFGLEDVSREKIVEAAKATRCHDFISQLPEGYDTPIGEEGKLLSGGERQKIVLARAFVRQPDVLILDEPTTGLDHESSKEFLNLVKTMKDRGITILYITHNRTELRLFDRLFTITPTKRVRELTLEDVDDIELK